MNKVEIMYKDKAAIDRGNYFLLDRQTAVQFLTDCQKENIEILGIDGFYKIDDKTIQPSMADSIDFTSVSYKGDKNRVCEDGKRFILNRGENLYFEFICKD